MSKCLALKGQHNEDLCASNSGWRGDPATLRLSSRASYGPTLPGAAWAVPLDRTHTGLGPPTTTTTVIGAGFGQLETIRLTSTARLSYRPTSPTAHSSAAASSDGRLARYARGHRIGSGQVYRTSATSRCRRLAQVSVSPAHTGSSIRECHLDRERQWELELLWSSESEGPSSPRPPWLTVSM